MSARTANVTVSAADRTMITEHGAPYFFEVEQCSLSASDTWSPYLQASVKAKLPPDTVLAALDPRNSAAPEVVIQMLVTPGVPRKLSDWPRRVSQLSNKVDELPAGTKFDPASADVEERLTAHLTVDELDIDYRAGTISLSLVSRELRLQEWTRAQGQVDGSGRFVDNSLTIMGSTVRKIVDSVMFTALHGKPGTAVAPYSWPFALWPYGHTVLGEGQSAWDVIERVTAGQDYKLIQDFDGAYRVIDRRVTVPVPPVDGVEELRRVLKRADWYDSKTAVEVVTNDAGVITSGTSVSHGKLQYTKRLDLRADVSKGDSPLRLQMLGDPFGRYLNTGDVHTYQAPLTLRMRPLQEFDLTVGGATRRAVAVTVTHNFPDCTTTISTREAG